MPKKAELLANAEYVVSPAFSGFTNIVYCRNLNVVVLLINAGRHTDMLFAKLAGSMSVPAYFVLGKDVVSGDADSDDTINMTDVEACLKHLPDLEKS